MKFIDLYFVLSSIAEHIDPSTDPDGWKKFVPAGKMSQSTAKDFYKRVANGIDWANRMTLAARRLSELLHNSIHQRPNLFEYDEKNACTLPGDSGTWSRMKSLLLEAMFWNHREKRYCLDHFTSARDQGEYFLRGPIRRDETDNWLTPNRGVLLPTSLGFDADELFAFLDANGVSYTHQHR